MLKFLKKCEKKAKLVLLYFRRILFVKNKFKVSFWTKLRLNIFGGYLADQYVLYDLKNNDKEEYLSEFDWYRSRYINEPFEPMFNNKIIAEEVLKQYIYTPQNYMFKNKGLMTSKEKEAVTVEDVYNLLKEKGSLFVKPFGKGKGKGVHRFDYTDNKLLIDENVIAKEDFYTFLEETDEWVICEFVKQNTFLNKIYNKTSNTIRLITLRDFKTGNLKVFFAVLRVGTKKTIPIDNGSVGGLVSKIDIETGKLSYAKSLHSLETYQYHPDSLSQIEGETIPDWQSLKEKVLDLARQFPYFYFIAWDILLTDKGPCVIEANNSSGVNIIQLWGGQKKGELGDFYRYHGAIK